MHTLARTLRASSLLGVLLAAACGGDGGGAGPDAPWPDAGPDAAPAPDAAKPQFTRLIVFGDSLSDAGTYAVGTVAALGGGTYTVNGRAPGIWTAQLADRLGVPTPCAAQTGLDGDPAKGFQVAPSDHPACTSYAQGGARVTNPVGPGNKALGGANAVLGQLTVPVVTQLARHIDRSAGGFASTELVTVLAGANDAFIHLAQVAGGAETTDQAIEAMSVAGQELAGYVKTQILARGATHVVVVTVPDISLTPYGKTLPASGQALAHTMLLTYNAQLQGGLSGTEALVVDAYARSAEQAANPAAFGIGDVATPACDLAPAKNPLGSSLVCSGANVIAGDTSTHLFADGVHPTPFGHKLLLDQVVAAMTARGWL